jgi:hypothetical protein
VYSVNTYLYILLVSIANCYNNLELNEKRNGEKQVVAYHTGDGNDMVRFDSDSTPIKIDNCATRTMSNELSDFDEGTMREVEDLEVHGYGGHVMPITQIGTIV